MDYEIRSVLNDYLNNVSDIYKTVSDWLKEKSLLTQKQSIEIFEEASGKYIIDKLIISHDQYKQIAEIQPVGAWIIGGRGRLDLIGKLDQHILIYLNKNGDYHTYSLYKEINQDGWYWIDNKSVGKAHILDKKLFFRLIAEVSDYEF